MDKESKEILEKTEKLIDALKHTKNYQEVQTIKEEMKQNQELLDQIEIVKQCQKEYIRSQKDEKKKRKLEEEQQKLEAHLLYQTYQSALEKVDQEYRKVEEKLNQFFESIL